MDRSSKRSAGAAVSEAPPAASGSAGETLDQLARDRAALEDGAWVCERRRPPVRARRARDGSSGHTGGCALRMALGLCTAVRRRTRDVHARAPVCSVAVERLTRTPDPSPSGTHPVFLERCAVLDAVRLDAIGKATSQRENQVAAAGRLFEYQKYAAESICENSKREVLESMLAELADSARARQDRLAGVPQADAKGACGGLGVCGWVVCVRVRGGSRQQRARTHWRSGAHRRTGAYRRTGTNKRTGKQAHRSAAPPLHPLTRPPLRRAGVSRPQARAPLQDACGRAGGGRGPSGGRRGRRGAAHGARQPAQHPLRRAARRGHCARHEGDLQGLEGEEGVRVVGGSQSRAEQSKWPFWTAF